MQIAEVVGTAVSTIKIHKIQNAKLKIVKTVNPFNVKDYQYLIVEDAIGVGAGELVLVTDDDEAVSDILNIKKAPMRAAIIAKIDKINIFKKVFDS